MTKLVMIIFLERMSGVGESVVDLFVGDRNAGHRIIILIKYCFILYCHQYNILFRTVGQSHADSVDIICPNKCLHSKTCY